MTIDNKVTKGVSGQSFNSGHATRIRSVIAVLPIMVSAHAYELSNAVQLLAKTAPRERKLGPCPETPSVTL